MNGSGPSFALVNGAACRFDLRRRGPRALVLVHELGGSLNSWDALLPALDGDLTVVRHDLRGAGMSEKIRGTADIDALADDIAALADHCGLDGPFGVMGAAMGAAVAVRFATRHSDQLDRLVLLGPALGVPAERRDAARELTETIEAHGLRSISENLLPRAFPEHLWTDMDARRLALARWHGADPEGYAASYRVLIENDFRPELASVACPTLVLAGAHDPFGPPEAVDAGTAALRDREFQVLEAGHFMAVQSPLVVAGPVNAFLGRA
jgi:3-oxoadipate enol-lactonase